MVPLWLLGMIVLFRAVLQERAAAKKDKKFLDNTAAKDHLKSQEILRELQKYVEFGYVICRCKVRHS